MLDKGIFTQDLLPNFYIYRLTMDGRSQTGLVVCTAIDEYLNDTIKKHELTRADKEADRIRHVDTLNANTGPIFLAYKENPDAKAIIDGYTAAVPPVYDFVSDDGIGHTVWVIDSDTEIGMLVQLSLIHIFAVRGSAKARTEAFPESIRAVSYTHLLPMSREWAMAVVI